MSNHLTLDPEPDGSTAVGEWEQQGQGHTEMEAEKRDNSEVLEDEVQTNRSAAVEPSTLTWPEDRERERAGERGVLGPDGGAVGKPERRTENGVGSQELLQKRENQPESETKTTWRDSMPEGDRWRDEEVGERQVKQTDGTLADDEEEDEDEDTLNNWMPEQAAHVFTPTVIVRPSSKLEEIPLKYFHNGEMHGANCNFLEPVTPTAPQVQYYPQWTEEPEDVCGGCGDVLKHVLGIGAAAVLFPLLVWGGYALLPFDVPLVDSAPLRLVYTLHCSFFAVIPIVLGVLVLGAMRLRYGALNPVYENKVGEERWQVAVHRNYIGDSLSLFLLYFLQLAVMATYISQDRLKIVPLLTIVFAFGRLIYWLCASLGSSVRSLGFGLSFLPILVMLGANLYFVCVSIREGAIFDVAPPTTAPPPKQRWWG
ncbi:hypothetical protein DPEC_G00202660 [Dallia pectoralis]|uniref:Uncharacterized protein n=1 Tax=Dallia pectoralis TaxID=75939 RepID=A0ACC2G9E2_DALPE|nr:hypothetical protein DPEC_G00202660 [Dallia pectoralis]